MHRTIEQPSMTFSRAGNTIKPIKVFQVNNSTILAIYKGRLSKYDILVRYRQKLNHARWSRIRTPKHIHWTVDVLMKMQKYPQLTHDFIDFFINIWNETKPLKSEKQRQNIDLKELLDIDTKNIEKFKNLSKHGEYNIRFLILLAKLLMLQEKTNRTDAYMFRSLLERLKNNEDLFRILTTATLNRK